MSDNPTLNESYDSMLDQMSSKLTQAAHVIDEQTTTINLLTSLIHETTNLLTDIHAETENPKIKKWIEENQPHMGRITNIALGKDE